MALSESQIRDATSYNRRKAASVGWRDHYRRIAYLFGLDNMSVTERVFAIAVHDWQARQTPPLTKDGKLGPKSWSRLHAEIDRSVNMTPNIPLPPWLAGGGGGGTTPTPVTPPPSPMGGGPRWFQIAQGQAHRWATEIAGWTPGRDRRHAETELDWDEAYFIASPRWGNVTHAVGEGPTRENMNWCAAFVNYCLHAAGYSHTGSASAHSFIWRWCWHFEALREPRQGCVIVIGNSDTNMGAHVAFLDRWHNLPRNPDGPVENIADRSFHLLGGNQSDKVFSRREPVRTHRDMLAARGRNGVTSPYLWPLQGPPTCTIGAAIPTERVHHCHYAPPAP